MPSLFRFLTVTGTIVALFSSVLYLLAVKYEPDQQLESKAVPGLKIRKQ